MKNFGLYLFICMFTVSVFSQTEKESKKIEIGAEVEAYPVGQIYTLTSTIFVKNNLALRFRVGANYADRGNKSGFNDSEIAKGYGFSIGLVKYFPVAGGNIVAGFATDFWFMKTDWIDNNQTGTTTDFVIQPWISAGYLYTFTSKFNAGIVLGFGREINTFTKGEQVGQGLMGSISLQANYKLN